MKMKTLCLQVFAAILLASCMSPWPPRPADLLFHVAATENAITAVTPGMIDHVAIMISADSVIEAVGKGVVTTPLDSLRKQATTFMPVCAMPTANGRLRMRGAFSDSPTTRSICLTTKPFTARNSCYFPL